MSPIRFIIYRAVLYVWTTLMFSLDFVHSVPIPTDLLIMNILGVCDQNTIQNTHFLYLWAAGDTSYTKELGRKPDGLDMQRQFIISNLELLFG